MHLNLPEKLESYAQAQVNKGLYSTAAEFVGELIRTHMQHTTTALKEDFYAAVRLGDEQLDRGNSSTLHQQDIETYIQSLAQRAKKNVENGDSTHSSMTLPL
jgi:Arc/MetJ-type ribon-helix-helix transcriptional regulator